MTGYIELICKLSATNVSRAIGLQIRPYHDRHRLNRPDRLHSRSPVFQQHRPVLSVLHSSNSLEIHSGIVSIDAKKEFDGAELWFPVLAAFGFDPKLISWVCFA